MSDEKKYSLISVDTGADASADEPQKVRTTHDVVDGEETFVVSSAPADESFKGDATSQDTFKADEPTTSATEETALSNDIPNDATGAIAPKSKTPKNDESDEVPFQRMQTIIIISLAVLIVAFFLYFNFLR